jgi:hypothetical protein
VTTNLINHCRSLAKKMPGRTAMRTRQLFGVTKGMTNVAAIKGFANAL